MKTKRKMSQIKKINENTGLFISGTGKKFKFTLLFFYDAVKFLMKKFSITEESAIFQVKYYLCSLSLNGLTYLKNNNNNALKNIVALEYEWDEMWIIY